MDGTRCCRNVDVKTTNSRNSDEQQQEVGGEIETPDQPKRCDRRTWRGFSISNWFSMFSKKISVLKRWALVWLMHSRAACQYQQQAINSSQYHCFIIIIILHHHHHHRCRCRCHCHHHGYYGLHYLSWKPNHIETNPVKNESNLMMAATCQTKPNPTGEVTNCQLAIINTPRQHPPGQKLWIFKQFNFSGNKSSFGRQRNAQNTQRWHLNKLRRKDNLRLDSSCN